MSYTRYTTFVSGYNTAESMTDVERLDDAKRAEWMNAHFRQIKRTGICKPETVFKMAAKMGIVHKLSAEAVSFDQSGKGRHDKKIIDLQAA